jgi:hypothetical protein
MISNGLGHDTVMQELIDRMRRLCSKHGMPAQGQTAVPAVVSAISNLARSMRSSYAEFLLTKPGNIEKSNWFTDRWSFIEKNVRSAISSANYPLVPQSQPLRSFGDNFPVIGAPRPIRTPASRLPNSLIPDQVARHGRERNRSRTRAASVAVGHSEPASRTRAAAAPVPHPVIQAAPPSASNNKQTGSTNSAAAPKNKKSKNKQQLPAGASRAAAAAAVVPASNSLTPASAAAKSSKSKSPKKVPTISSIAAEIPVPPVESADRLTTASLLAGALKNVLKIGSGFGVTTTPPAAAVAHSETDSDPEIDTFEHDDSYFK